MTSTQRQPTARAYAALSIGAALMTIGLKFAAYRLTNSVGLLSDALESSAAIDYSAGRRPSLAD
jgi:divalent metal cation (Fe/Co/Zn/Cd) transporter